MNTIHSYIVLVQIKLGCTVSLILLALPGYLDMAADMVVMVMLNFAPRKRSVPLFHSRSILRTLKATLNGNKPELSVDFLSLG